MEKSSKATTEVKDTTLEEQNKQSRQATLTPEITPKIII